MSTRPRSRRRSPSSPRTVPSARTTACCRRCSSAAPRPVPATCSTGWATCSSNGFDTRGYGCDQSSDRSGMAIDVGTDASPSANAASPPATSYRRFLGIRIQLRWKLLAAFAGAFTVVFVFLAIWIFQYTTATAMARLEIAAQRRRHRWREDDRRRRLRGADHHGPGRAGSDEPDGPGLPRQPAVRVHRAGPARHLHHHHRCQPVHLLRGPCRRAPVLRGLRRLPARSSDRRDVPGARRPDRRSRDVRPHGGGPHHDDEGTRLHRRLRQLDLDLQSHPGRGRAERRRDRRRLPADLRDGRPGRRAEAAVPGPRHQLRRAARPGPRPLDLPDAAPEATDRSDRAHRGRGVRPRRSGHGAHPLPRRDVHARRVGLDDGGEGRGSRAIPDP